jgi:hypothetical protein
VVISRLRGGLHGAVGGIAPRWGVPRAPDTLADDPGRYRLTDPRRPRLTLNTLGRSIYVLAIGGGGTGWPSSTTDVVRPSR